jgi:hypothetical protein
MVFIRSDMHSNLYFVINLCKDENFVQKAGAQRAAEKFGIALIAPDTSPSLTILFINSFNRRGKNRRGFR